MKAADSSSLSPCAPILATPTVQSQVLANAYGKRVISPSRAAGPLLAVLSADAANWMPPKEPDLVPNPKSPNRTPSVLGESLVSTPRAPSPLGVKRKVTQSHPWFGTACDPDCAWTADQNIISMMLKRKPANDDLMHRITHGTTDPVVVEKLNSRIDALAKDNRRLKDDYESLVRRGVFASPAPTTTNPHRYSDIVEDGETIPPPSLQTSPRRVPSPRSAPSIIPMMRQSPTRQSPRHDFISQVDTDRRPSRRGSAFSEDEGEVTELLQRLKMENNHLKTKEEERDTEIQHLQKKLRQTLEQLSAWRTQEWLTDTLEKSPIRPAVTSPGRKVPLKRRNDSESSVGCSSSVGSLELHMYDKARKSESNFVDKIKSENQILKMDLQSISQRLSPYLRNRTSPPPSERIAKQATDMTTLIEGMPVFVPKLYDVTTSPSRSRFHRSQHR